MNKQKKHGEQLYFASSPKLLEPLLAEEIRGMGIKKITLKKGGVEFKTTPIRALRVILYSRIASRVFKHMADFDVEKEKDIYKFAKDVQWDEVMRLDQTFKISTLLGVKARGFFKNSMILSQILKDGICDVFRDKTGERPSVDTKSADLSFLIRIESSGRKGQPWAGSLLLDMCGTPLSSRGYRASGHKAPLRENLAAGIVMSTDWDSQSDVFFDSMCGTGTLLIEAALIAGNIPPSFIKLYDYVNSNERPWSFLSQKWFSTDVDLMDQFQEEAEKTLDRAIDGINDLPGGQFYGSDTSWRALDVARDCIEAANLTEVISLSKEDATEVKPPAEAPGVIICNAPYGERIGEEEKLGKLYHDYGENLKANYKGYRAFIFTSRADLRKQISLQTSKRIQLNNGNIECRLLKYDLY